MARSKPTAAAYSASHMSVAVLALLSSAGFSRSSAGAADLLAEVMQRYVQLIGSTCVQHANHAGRSVIAPQDLRASLEHILGGDPIEELLEWAEDEDKLPIPNQTFAQTNGANGTNAGASGSSVHPALQDPMRGKDLVRILNTGRVPPSPSDVEEVHFRSIPAENFEQAAAESIIRHQMTKQLVWPASKEANGVDGSTQASSSSEDLESLLFSDAEDDESEASATEDGADGLPSLKASPQPRKRQRMAADDYMQSRRFGETIIDYVPAYLPLFPGNAAPTESSTTALIDRPAEVAASDPATVEIKVEPVEVDPEYVLEEQRRKELAQRKADEAAAAAAAEAAEKAKLENADGEGAEPAPSWKRQQRKERRKRKRRSRHCKQEGSCATVGERQSLTKHQPWQRHIRKTSCEIWSRTWQRCSAMPLSHRSHP